MFLKFLAKNVFSQVERPLVVGGAVYVDIIHSLTFVNPYHFRYFLLSPRSMGKWSNLTNIFQMGWNHQLAGQIMATSYDPTPNGGLVREIPLFQGSLGWWHIIIWPELDIFGIQCEAFFFRAFTRSDGSQFAPISLCSGDQRVNAEQIQIKRSKFKTRSS